MKKYFLYTLTIALSFSLAKADSASTKIIKPSSVKIEKGTGNILTGIYSDWISVDGFTSIKNLVQIETSGRYDETVLSYKNIIPGIYHYRFANISKMGVKVSNWANGGAGGCTDGIKSATYKTQQKVISKTKDFVLLSKAGASEAEIRLTAVPESKIEDYHGAVLAVACSGPNLFQILEWDLAPKPSTDWIRLEVKHAQTLTFRIPKEVSDISKFELIKSK